MSVEIFIMVKVDKADQVHAVMAALTSMKCYEAGVKTEHVKIAATDNVPEPSAHIQKVLDKEFDHSSEDVNPVTAITPLTINLERDLGNSRTVESHVSPSCPHTPVTRIYESVRQRIFDALRSDKPIHKDDYGCAAALVQKGEIIWDGDNFAL